MQQEYPNATTIKAYNDNVIAYQSNTPSSSSTSNPIMLEWIDYALHMLPANATILEIGSGTPRDALYMREKGFRVLCSDATPGFVKALRKAGEEALLINVINDDLPGIYKMIFANAVIPHLTPSDLDRALKNIYRSLDDNGIFAFSTKIGVGETWVIEKFNAARFIHFWQESEIVKILHQHGFEVIFKSNNIGNFPNHLWLNIVARKSKIF